jgi:hypothetical protein
MMWTTRPSSIVTRMPQLAWQKRQDLSRIFAVGQFKQDPPASEFVAIGAARCVYNAPSLAQTTSVGYRAIKVAVITCGNSAN